MLKTTARKRRILRKRLSNKQIESEQIRKITVKLVPLLQNIKPDALRNDRGLNDLKLWQLPNRRLWPDKEKSKRFVDMDGILRYEELYRIYHPPVPVSMHSPLRELKLWRKDLEKLHKKLKKRRK